MKYIGFLVKVGLFLVLLFTVALIASALRVPPGFQLLAVLCTALIWPAMVVINKILLKKRNDSAESTTDLSSSIPTTSATSGGTDSNEDSIQEAEPVLAQAATWLRENSSFPDHSKTLNNLPWYLCLGPKRSGKTSLLTASECDFYLLPGQRPTEFQTISPTHNWKIRITNEAVFFDLPGNFVGDRLQSQIWNHHISLLARYRKTYPFDGLILTVDIRQFSEPNQDQQEVKIHRTVLDYLKDSVKVEFPIYLVFTHLDQVPGFQEFFSFLEIEDQNQVWGMTFPLTQRKSVNSRFEAEYELLVRSLYRRRMTILSQAKTPNEQLKVFEFPLQMEGLKSKFASYVNVLSKPSSFKEVPWIRGIYFTSVEGQVINQPLLSTNLSDRPESFDPSPDQGSSEITICRSYFVRQFFHRILFDDRFLCLALQPQPKTRRYVPASIVALTLLLCLLLTGIFTISYQNNQIFLLEMKRKNNQLEEILKKKSTLPITEFSLNDPLSKAELEALEQVRLHLDLIDIHKSQGVPWRMSWGLYAPPSIEPQLKNLYFSTVHRRFVEPALLLLEKDLTEFSTTADSLNISPEQQEQTLSENYDRLKVYLMLGFPERSQSSFLTAHLAPYWKQHIPSEYSILAERQLAYFARHAHHDQAPHFLLNQDLVLKVREKLSHYPALDRSYKRVTTELDNQFLAVSVSSIIGIQGNGYISGTAVVPGSYTISAYNNAIDPALLKAAADLKNDDWVLGSGSGITIGTVEIQKLKHRYLSNYADAWRRFLLGIGIRPFQTKQEALEGLNILAGPESPIDLILIEVSRQTRLSSPPQEISLWGGVKGWFQQQTKLPETRVETEFKPVHQYVDQMQIPRGFFSNQPTPIGNPSSPYAQYRAILRLVADQIDLVPSDQFETISQQLLTGGGTDRMGFLRHESSVNRLFEGFRTESSLAAAKLCKQPLGNVRALLFGQTYAQLNQAWKSQIYPQAKQLETGFPFTKTGVTSIEDLNRYLNPANGALENFTKTFLSSSIELVNNRYQLKETGAFRLHPDFIAYLNRMKVLQISLFPPNSQRSEVSYELTIQGSQTATILLDIDGIHLEARRGIPQAAKFIWPPRPGTSTGVNLMVINQGKSQELSFPGEWGLFAFYGSGNPKAEQNQYLLTFTLGAETIKIMLTPTGLNPFGANLFQGVTAPVSISAGTEQLIK